MSRAKLNRLLGLSPDHDFFLMCWTIHALQTGRQHKARARSFYPAEVITEDLGSPYAARPWAIETLLNECLATRKEPHRRYANVNNFRIAREFFNTLTQVENEEDGSLLKRIKGLDIFQMIGHRQFEWQRGVWSRPFLYRSAFIYNGERTRAYFEQSKGFTMEEFTLACFLLRGLALEWPIILVNDGLAQFGMPSLLLRRILNHISLPHQEARARAFEMRSGVGHISYKPSLLRLFPLIELESGRFSAPLPDLITRRGATGLFYDVVGGPDDIRNEIAHRFETYCQTFLASAFDSLSSVREYKYRIKKGIEFDTPDVLIRQNDQLNVVCECKATKMSHAARFSETPVDHEERSYREMIRGVFQIWRFCSHKRRGFLPNEVFHPDIRGVVLTLDPWLTMSNSALAEVFRRASQMADEKDPEINDHDKIPVIFCAIDELEQVASIASAESFISAVRASSQEQFRGWLLYSVHKKIAPDTEQENDYPFSDRIADVLPWWNNFQG